MTIKKHGIISQNLCCGVLSRSSWFGFNGNFLIIIQNMKIVSLSENKNIEKRIAITPDIAKKYIDLGFEVLLSENYGSHLGIDDNLYKIRCQNY